MKPLKFRAGKTAFFVGLLDFLMANEADLIDVADAAGPDPAEIRRMSEAQLRGFGDASTDVCGSATRRR